ncbi:hypothetical protein [Metapseudomonas otitidis]|uniref:hypothetical protein n=1 Tax=Metapseudomonas otitidis TaxID=319939 RepID=UPI0013F65E93|nr:hypothetical protein [Pseudomonas otitidis]
MRAMWELLRVLWVVGCIPVGALLLIVAVLSGFNLPFLMGISDGEDSAVRWLFWGLVLYFVGGFGTFLWVDLLYANKLKRVIARLKPNGFRPQIELIAKMSDAYLGVDTSAGRLLAYPINGKERLFSLDEIHSWRIVPVGKRNHRLELLTCDLKAPVFRLVLNPAEVLATEARLKTLLGA